MKILIRIAALLALSSLVFAAGNKTFDWTPPTSNTDGSVLTQGEIASYNFYCDGNTVAIHNQPNVPLNTDQWNAPDNTFSTGDHSCFATTINTDGVESGPSNAANFTVAPATPNPPVLSVRP